jgi:hypothetical protein
MRARWNLVSAALVAGVMLASACGGAQPATTTEAPTTTVQSTTTASETTTSAAPTTTSVAPTTTSSTGVTTTTLAEIIPGVTSALYENKELGFSLARPASTLVVAQGFEGFLPLTQTPVVALTLPEQLFAGTNLTEAGVYVGASSAAGVTSNWNVPVADSGESAAGTAEINGLTFAVFNSEEGAAGNIYLEKVYRTLHGGTCLEIVELLHSGEIGNYPPDVKEFDRAKFEGYLEAMVHTLTFAVAP